MSNEEKILSMLTKMQDDIDSIKETLKQNGILKKPRRATKEQQLAALRGLSTLLNDEEKKALGEYMEEEEARKVALYG